MLTGDQISALAVAASWSRAAQPLEAAEWQEGMWLESQPACLSFSQLRGSHLQLLLFQCLDDQKLL